MFVWRMATARRGANAAAAGARGSRGEVPTRAPRLDARVAAERLRDAASLGWRVFSSAVLLIATALLVTGGVTLTVLSPRWLGIALLVFGVAALGAAVTEVLTVRRQLAYRRFRRRAAALRREIS